MNRRANRFVKNRKHLSSMLSQELFDEYKVNNMPIKKGDTVKILRGAFQGVEGTITKIDSKKCVINVEGATREKSDGTILYAPIHASKVEITKLILDDPRRKDIVERRITSKRSRDY